MINLSGDCETNGRGLLRMYVPDALHNMVCIGYGYGKYGTFFQQYIIALQKGK